MRGFVLLACAFCTLLPGWAQELPRPEFVQFRQKAGLSVPQWSPSMASAVEGRAQRLAMEGQLSHNDQKGRGPGVQMLLLGFPPGDYGEVLGAGQTWQAVWGKWLESRTHREVLTTPGWTQWALGSAPVGKTTVWVLRVYRP